MSAKKAPKTLNDLKPVSEVTVCFIDHGLFISQALRLAESCKKVYVYTPWEAAFPKMTSMIGFGYESIEIVDSIWGKAYQEADVFVFPDLNSGPLQDFLVSQGKAVWGCRMGEVLELDREGCKKILEAIDMPVGKFEHIKGMDNLRTYLRSHDGVFVKMSKWRGTFETFKSENYRQVEPKLDEVAFKLGPLKDVVEFTVEDALNDCVEIGTDGYVIDGKQPTKLMSGIEIKDLCYVGVFTDYLKIPEPIRRFNDRMEPVFAAYGYRGWMSSEVRVDKSLTPYMVDGCMRSPSPPNELWQQVYANFAEIIWGGSNGIVVDPIPNAKFGAEILIHSAWSSTGWQPVDIEPEVREFVKLRNSMKIGGREYISPMGDGLPEIGAVIGMSDVSVEDAIEHAVANCEGVSGYYIDFPKAATKDALDEIEKLDKLGLNFFK